MQRGCAMMWLSGGRREGSRLSRLSTSWRSSGLYRSEMGAKVPLMIFSTSAGRFCGSTEREGGQSLGQALGRQHLPPPGLMGWSEQSPALRTCSLTRGLPVRGTPHRRAAAMSSETLGGWENSHLALRRVPNLVPSGVLGFMGDPSLREATALR